MDQMAQEPNGPPQRRQVPQRAPVPRAPVGQGQPALAKNWQAAQPNTHYPSGNQAEQMNHTPIDLKQFIPEKDTSASKSTEKSRSGGRSRIQRSKKGPAVTARELLQSPGGARQAMIASEILNRPEHRWE